MGFPALAPTSAGFANSLGRLDGQVTRDEAIAHAAMIVETTSLPVSADLESGFGDAPKKAAETVRRAVEIGLAGCPIENFSGNSLYGLDQGTEPIRAAAHANQATDTPLALTPCAENHIRGNPDLADTIARQQAYQEAGAGVLYTPGLMPKGDIQSVVAPVDRSINVLIMPEGPSAPKIFETGGTRISTGNAIAVAAQAEIAHAGREFLDQGTHHFWTKASGSTGVARNAMASDD